MQNNTFFEKYFSVKGRLPRFVFFKRINILGLIVVFLWLTFTLVAPSIFLLFYPQNDDSFFLNWILVFIGSIFILPIPVLPLIIRRLHDLGKPWHSSLLAFIPFLNAWLYFKLHFSVGQKFTNEYGPDPLATENK